MDRRKFIITAVLLCVSLPSKSANKANLYPWKKLFEPKCVGEECLDSDYKKHKKIKKAKELEDKKKYKAKERELKKIERNKKREERNILRAKKRKERIKKRREKKLAIKRKKQ